MKLPKHIQNYEPIIALTDGSDGLTFYKRYVDIIKNILKPHGTFFCEVGDKLLVDNILTLFANSSLVTKLYNDLQGNPRVIGIYYV